MCGIVLMRHGESICGLENCLAGRTDVAVKLIKSHCRIDPEAIVAALNAVANQGKAKA